MCARAGEKKGGAHLQGVLIFNTSLSNTSALFGREVRWLRVLAKRWAAGLGFSIALRVVDHDEEYAIGYTDKVRQAVCPSVLVATTRAAMRIVVTNTLFPKTR